MSVKDLQSDLLIDLSTEEQQHLSGGYGFGFGGFRPGFVGRGWGGHRGFGGFRPGFGGHHWGGPRRGGWFY